MSGSEWAALIVAVCGGLATILGLLGGGVKYIVTLILTAYKEQAASTISAKDRDLTAKDTTIEKQDQEIQRLHTIIDRVTDLRVQWQDRVPQ